MVLLLACPTDCEVLHEVLGWMTVPSSRTTHTVVVTKAANKKKVDVIELLERARHFFGWS
jgi:hypothetical protein